MKGLIEQGEENNGGPRFKIEFKAPHTNGWIPWGKGEMTQFDAERHIKAVVEMWGTTENLFRLVPVGELNHVA